MEAREARKETLMAWWVFSAVALSSFVYKSKAEGSHFLERVVRRSGRKVDQ